MSRKNVLTLVRASVFAALALVLAVIASLAWFVTSQPKMGILEVSVKGKIDAEVRLYWMNELTNDEKYYGVLADSLTVFGNHKFYDTTNPSVGHDESDIYNLKWYRNIIAANLTPGVGEYYKMTVKIPAGISGKLTVELVNINWNTAGLAEYNISVQKLEEISGYIWLNSFFHVAPNPIGDIKEKLIFEKDSQGNYNKSMAFISNENISDPVTDIYFWFLLNKDFSLGFAGTLFTVEKIRVSIS